MRKRKKTIDPAANVVGFIGAAGVATFAVAMGTGPLALIGVPLFFLGRALIRRDTAEHLDSIAEESSDTIGHTWDYTRKPGETHGRVSVTKWTDAIIPIPQTRIYEYRNDDED